MKPLTLNHIDILVAHAKGKLKPNVNRTDSSSVSTSAAVWLLLIGSTHCVSEINTSDNVASHPAAVVVVGTVVVVGGTVVLTVVVGTVVVVVVVVVGTVVVVLTTVVVGTVVVVVNACELLLRSRENVSFTAESAL